MISENFLYTFSDMKSVSNLLAGELLRDVHKVCSTSDDDDTSHLQAYLLEGRGAALLKVLHTIGVEVCILETDMLGLSMFVVTYLYFHYSF